MVGSLQLKVFQAGSIPDLAESVLWLGIHSQNVLGVSRTDVCCGIELLEGLLGVHRGGGSGGGIRVEVQGKIMDGLLLEVSLWAVLIVELVLMLDWG